MELLDMRGEACHWHDPLEVVWVLRGRLCLQEANMRYHLRQGDIYVVNYGETHRLAAEDDEGVLLARLYIDVEHFTKHIPNLKEISFAHYCFSDAPNPYEALADCRQYLHSIFGLLAGDGAQGSERNGVGRNGTERNGAVEQETAALLDRLVDTFQYIYYVKEEGGRYMDVLARSGLTSEQMRRLHHITYYIYMNCQEKLTLDDVARAEFYSKFHISHFIRRAFGLSYQDTLMLSRAIVSERLLLGTDRNLDQIAADVGFSTRSQYCQQFRRWHDMSPAQYRKENAPGAPGNRDAYVPVGMEVLEGWMA
ncbi:MAG: AraC family transcriptional regulator [Clostridiales Family XIII bacterium]|jgi:AraC-like DNA-binding protein|nr:AraC family transcriptional regulator [Clostridiales Family XIII bacterium]